LNAQTKVKTRPGRWLVVDLLDDQAAISIGNVLGFGS
jgi:hypothetical protein